MKKLLLLLFAVCTALGSYAYDVCVDGIYYNLDVTNKTAEVTSGDQEYTGSVVIPQSINKDSDSYSVTSIGNGAFNGSSLTSIIIPNSVTTIGQFAFCACFSLTSIIIPNSVTTIGTGAFWVCLNLTYVIIPNSITCIEESTFQDCYSLASITIPNSVTSIGQFAFQNCM